MRSFAASPPLRAPSLALRGEARARKASGLAFRALALIVALALGVTRTRADAAPAKPPAELLVSVAVGPAGSLGGLQAYLESVKPGAGAQATDQAVRAALAEMVGASSLDGFDPASPIYILVSEAKGEPAFALLGKVTSPETLAKSAGAVRTMVDKKASWAVLGAKPLLDKLGPYALATIAGQPAPPTVSATVYLPNVLNRYLPRVKTALAQFQAGMQQTSGSVAKVTKSYFDGLVSAATDSEQLRITLEASAGTASVDFALIPRARSRLAAFAAIQQPSDFALLDRLPPATPTMVFSGHSELGPYSDGILTAVVALYGPDTSRDLMAAMQLARKAMTGESAATLTMAPGTGMEFTQLYGTSDVALADKAIAQMLGLFKTGRTMESGKMSVTFKSVPDTTTHDGVTLRSYDTTYDLSKVPAAQRAMMEIMAPPGTRRSHVGAFDGFTLVTSTADSSAVRRALGAARGKSAHYVPSKSISALLADARAHKDSFAMVMDLGVIMSMMAGKQASDLPFLLSLGFADRNVHIRIAMSAATIRGLLPANP